MHLFWMNSILEKNFSQVAVCNFLGFLETLLLKQNLKNMMFVFNFSFNYKINLPLKMLSYTDKKIEVIHFCNIE